MVIGVLRIELALPENDSLKGKRAVVRSLLDRIRGRFDVAAAEVAGLDEHRRAVVAFATLSNDGRHADEVLAKVGELVDASSAAPIRSRRVRLVRLEDDDEAPSMGDEVVGSWSTFDEDGDE
jgi:uncharacterized protein YlxP (DUF503 family)